MTTVVLREGDFPTSAQSRTWVPASPPCASKVQALPPPTGLLSPRGPTSCKTTASPSSFRWPLACSIWRKRPRYGGSWGLVHTSLLPVTQPLPHVRPLPRPKECPRPRCQPPLSSHACLCPLPSSWPSPAASCAAPSVPWALRVWSPPLWQPCLSVSHGGVGGFFSSLELLRTSEFQPHSCVGA